MSARTPGPRFRRGSTIVLGLSPAARISGTAGVGATVHFSDQVLEFTGLDRRVQGLLARLRSGLPVGAIGPALAARRAGPVPAAEWEYCVGMLDRAGLIVRWLRRPGLELRVTGPGRLTVDPPARGMFSRFGFLQPVEEGWVVESAGGAGRVEITGRRAAGLVGALGRPISAGTVARAAGLGAAAGRDVVSLLWGAGLLTPIRPDGTTAEDADPALMTWEFADLLLHTRSRNLDGGPPVGARYGFGKRIQLPVIGPGPRGKTIKLPRPDLGRAVRRDPPFARVVERRRSVRRFGTRPLTLAEVAEVLYRAARVKSVRPPNASVPYSTSRRPYPSGGACHPLELYLAVGHCEGLGVGLFHYHPVRHGLTAIKGGEPGAAALLADAWRDDGGYPVPDLMIVVTARFRRVAWKYRGIAYATILKDVGALMQTLYLTTTAMGLAGCAVGAGDAGRLAALLGTPAHQESSVGEFVLGRPVGG